MDFLKTLLAYMALMATLGVQEGPAPQTVPTPTPLPAHMTATPMPHTTAAPTATPGPSAAAGPALTPNKRYEKVEFGDKGTNVKKLQNRLIELGFMPKGSADGQYGYQTYNAVKDFQRANGLEVDGVAGPITLTYLYENPNIVTPAEPTAVPTATPTPSLPPLVSQTTTTTAAQQVVTAVTVAPVQAATAAPTAAPTAEPTAAPTAEPVSATLEAIAPAYPDALVLLENAYIISGTSGDLLSFKDTAAGATVLPNLWQNEFGAIVVSLPQLADCLGWSLQGSGENYTLKACGYTISLQFQSGSLMVLVDNVPVYIPEEDALLHEGTIFISEGFLRTALGASTVYDLDENALVLFLKDKSVANAQD